MELTAKRKKYLLLSIIALLFIWAIVWVLNHTFIEISVLNNTGGEIIYTIADTNSGRSTSETSKNSRLKKLVKRGQYQVAVSQGSTSYFEAVRVGGLFRGQKVAATLKPEQARTFIGDAPGYCMAYSNSILVSNNCGGPYSETKTHIPATDSLPTYTLRDKDGLKATTEGFATTPEGTFLLVQQPISEDETMLHIIYSLATHSDKPSSLKRVKDLPQLNPEHSYSIQAYKTGFIVYDPTFSEVYYFSNLSAEPTKINLAANDKTLSAQSLSSYEDTVAVYSNINNLNNKSVKNPRTEVVWQSGNTVKHITFNKHYHNALKCGENRLCALNGNKLDIYDIQKDKPKYLYSLTDVQTIAQNQTSLYMVTSLGLLEFNPSTKIGSYAYSFGGYKYNTMIPSGRGVIISVSSPKSREAAILVSPGENDSIDKRVLELEALPEVSNVSAYKNYVHLTPNLGEPVYNPDTGFGFEPAVRASANDSINAAIKKIGLDTNTYKVINVIP